MFLYTPRHFCSDARSHPFAVGVELILTVACFIAALTAVGALVLWILAPTSRIGNAAKTALRLASASLLLFLLNLAFMPLAEHVLPLRPDPACLR
jgi:hypothetical protein